VKSFLFFSKTEYHTNFFYLPQNLEEGFLAPPQFWETFISRLPKSYQGMVRKKIAAVNPQVSRWHLPYYRDIESLMSSKVATGENLLSVKDLQEVFTNNFFPFLTFDYIRN